MRQRESHATLSNTKVTTSKEERHIVLCVCYNIFCVCMYLWHSQNKQFTTHYKLRTNKEASRHFCLDPLIPKSEIRLREHKH